MELAVSPMIGAKALLPLRKKEAPGRVAAGRMRGRTGLPYVYQPSPQSQASTRNWTASTTPHPPKLRLGPSFSRKGRRQARRRAAMFRT